MIQGVAPHEGCLDEDAQVFDDLVLPGEVVEFPGADLIFEFQVAFYVSDIFFGIHFIL